MDELLMHVNTKHRADDVDDAERSSNYPNVTLINDSVEEIVDLVVLRKENIQTSVIKLMLRG